MTGTITTGSLPRLVQDGIHRVYGNGMDMHPTLYTSFFEVKNSSKNFEVDVQFEGFGLTDIKTEGDDIAFDSSRQGFTPKYPMVTYAKGFICTKEAIRDERYGVLNDKARRLGRSVAVTQDVIGANVLNNGFDSGFLMIDGDGSPLFATNHVQGPSGGTYSNRLAVDADLSEAALETMLIQISQAVDERGLKMAIKADKLIIEPSNLFEAQRILNSALQNDTANNATNAVKDLGSVSGGFLSNPYLTDVDAWFLTTDMPNGLCYFIRQAPEFGEDNAFTSGNARFKADFRVAPGWTESKGVYGTPGS